MVRQALRAPASRDEVAAAALAPPLRRGPLPAGHQRPDGTRRGPARVCVAGARGDATPAGGGALAPTGLPDELGLRAVLRWQEAVRHHREPSEADHHERLRLHQLPRGPDGTAAPAVRTGAGVGRRARGGVAARIARKSEKAGYRVVRRTQAGSARAPVRLRAVLDSQARALHAAHVDPGPVATAARRLIDAARDRGLWEGVVRVAGHARVPQFDGCFAEIGAAHRPGQAVHGRVHAECARPHRRREVLPTHRRHAAALHLYLNSGRAALHLRLLLPVYLLVRDRAEIKQ